MKKKINYLDILENRANVVLSEQTEVKAREAIRRAAEQPPRKIITLFFRPAFAFALAALFLVVPVSVFIFTYRDSSPEHVIVYTTQETSHETENLLLEVRGEDDIIQETGDLYREDVRQVDVRITSKGLIMKWKNPEDTNLKEIIIEKRKKKISGMETFFPGKVNLYVDSEYDAGDYYIIRCIDEKNMPSKGVYVIPQEGY